MSANHSGITLKIDKMIKIIPPTNNTPKKGNMIIRGWVQPPSRSKTGFDKNNWRTFMVSRLTQVEIFDEETFDTKRPGYKEGDDKSMSTTYVTSDWSSTPEVPKDTEPTSEPQQTEPTSEPTSVEPQSSDLPKPEPENKPSIEPPKVDDSEDNEDEEEDETNNYDGLNENIKRIKRLLY